MQGVERYRVRLMEHDPQWKEEFETVREQIQAVWGTNVLEIQHIGSTAIPSIPAKPILDVAVLVKSLERMDSAALQKLGYEDCGAQKPKFDRWLFVLRGENALSLRHIHCYGQGHPEFAQCVGFRDYLNAHPETANEYAELKRKLAEQFADDRVAYTAAKHDFIQSVYAKLEE